MQERRKLARTRVLKGAKILLGKSSVIDCVVRDFDQQRSSSTGPKYVRPTRVFRFDFGCRSFDSAIPIGVAEIE